MTGRFGTLASLLFAGALLAAGGTATATGSASTTPATVNHRIIAPPALRVGEDPVGVALYPAAHTLYISNQNDNTVSVASTRRCSSRDARGCGQRVHSIGFPAGANPQGIVVNTATRTAYVADLGTGTISVLDLRRCNAANLSGCGRIVATVADPRGPTNLALDPSTDTVYTADIGSSAPGDTVTVINGAACNGHDIAGCSLTAPTVKVGLGPVAIAIDEATHTAYVDNDTDPTVSVIDTAHCNGVEHSGCGQVTPTIHVGAGGNSIDIDPASHTAYVANGNDDTVSVVDTATCNASRHSGCGQRTTTIPVGNNPYAVEVDQKLHAVYVANQKDNTVSAIGMRTCDAADRSGCRARPPAISTGGAPNYLVTDPATDTLYATDGEGNTVSVLTADTCDAANTTGCRHDEPVAGVGAGPSGLALDTANHTVYVTNATSDTVSVIDADACNAARLGGCRHPAATVRLDSVTAAIGPAGIALDAATGTLYVADFGSDTVSVIDARTCNAIRTAGCGQHPRKIRVGSGPFAVAVDTSTNTVYVADAGSMSDNDTVSVINGATCNATHHGGCGQTVATVAVGVGPRGLAVDESTHTLYVTNTGSITGGDTLGHTVSVINAATCNGIRHIGCAAHPATIKVGRYPFGVVVDQATNTIYVADNNNGDGPAGLSTIKGDSCDAGHPAGCAKPATTVAAPGRADRNVALDASTHTLYVVGKQDASVAVIDVAKPASIPDSPRFAVGSTPEAIVFDPANHTVYVADEADNTVSVLPAVP